MYLNPFLAGVWRAYWPKIIPAGRDIKVKCHEACVVYVVHEDPNAHQGRDGGFTGRTSTPNEWMYMPGMVTIYPDWPELQGHLRIWRQEFKASDMKAHGEAGVTLFTTTKDFVGMVFVGSIPAVSFHSVHFRKTDTKFGNYFKHDPVEFQASFGLLPAHGEVFRALQKRGDKIIWGGRSARFWNTHVTPTNVSLWEHEDRRRREHEARTVRHIHTRT